LNSHLFEDILIIKTSFHLLHEVKMADRKLKKAAESWVRKQIGREGSHDWWHVWRVQRLALRLARGLKVDRQVLELAALTHDVKDWKESGDPEAGPRSVQRWLRRQGLDAAKAERVAQVLREVSFKGAKVATCPSSLEAALVQDADRLDALGAIGIARTFAYGGSKGRPLYTPGVKPVLHQSFKQYRRSQSHTLNHFYEKLLLLKARLNTPAAKKIAVARHRELERFARVFKAEWAGRA
jgi:uncharacterized protein